MVRPYPHGSIFPSTLQGVGRDVREKLVGGGRQFPDVRTRSARPGASDPLATGTKGGGAAGKHHSVPRQLMHRGC